MSPTELKMLSFLKRTQKMLFLEFLAQKYVKGFLIRENHFQIAKGILLSQIDNYFHIVADHIMFLNLKHQKKINILKYVH